MITVSYLEHSRSLRPSIFLNAYLFLTIPLDIAQARTLWLASTTFDEIIFSRLFTATIAVKAALIILESQHKSKVVVCFDVKEHSPEETSGLFGLGAFVWLNQLFLTGYRKILTLDDLFPLDQNLASEVLQLKLATRIEASQCLGQKHGLAKTLAKTLAVPLLLPVGPRIAMTAFQFCQPFLISTLLDYLQQPLDDSSRNVGYGLIGATTLIYTGIAMSGAFYWYFQERALYMARGALAGAVYQKTVRAKMSAADDSAALTLISTDIERIIKGCLNLHEFWANTVEVGLACWLLSYQIGIAFVAPLIVVSCCVICSAILARFTGPRQKAWMGKIQKRVGLTASVIGQMKHLKISGLAAPVEDLIQRMRVDELKTGSKFRMVLVLAAVISYTPLCISPVMAFAFAARTLDITTIFTSISYIFLLATPLGILFQMFPSLLAALTCLTRIQEFLEKDSRLDYRKSALAQSRETSAEDDTQEEDRGAKPAPAIKISEGSFGWQVDQLSLKDVNLDIQTSRLTIIVGPVASGKSTLCKVLLGEAPVAHGQVVMHSCLSMVGYCDQIPYLWNATIRENIVGFAPFNQVRYNEVIEATMLQPDLAVLPQGDTTKVGSNGIILSGGQKQRVSMARALYLNTDFLVFDDILSGLDADTEEQVFRKVFSPDGLIRRRNATAVLCTHSVRHLPSADHIVALGSDGRVVEQGAFRDLLASNKYIRSLRVQEKDDAHSEDTIRLADAKAPTQPEQPQALTAKSVATPSHVDEQKRMTGDPTVYRHYFTRLNTISIIAFIVFGLGWGFFYNFTTVWLKFWSQDGTSTRPLHSNLFYISLYGLFQLSTLASLFFISVICYRTMIQVSGARLHKEALRTVINAPLKFFTTTDTGIVINLFSQDLTLIDGELPMALVNLALDGFACIGMAAVIATSSPFLAITYPFLVVVLYIIQKFYLCTSRQIRLLDLEAKSPL